MHILINFLIALAFSSIGFLMYVYFFSVGYGFSIAGIAIAMLIIFRNSLTPTTILMCAVLIIYGIRLGGYLLIRENKSINYKNLLKGETKSNVPIFVKCSIWLACALLYICQTAPVLFRLENGKPDDLAAYIGIVLMILGVLIEAVADIQKSASKKKDPKMFVSTGLYRFVRCPNYFGELLLWTGVLVSGLTVFNSPFQWVLALLGYIGIVYVMFSGARRLELRQDRNYGEIPEYQHYVKTVPIIIPLIPLYSVKKHKWLVG